MPRLLPKNWASFQHYRDRAPTWIKLHKSLLDDYDYQCLPVASRALAPMLWLLASESKDLETGAIEYSPQKLSFRLRMSEPEFIESVKPLIMGGFFELEQDASEPLAELKHDDSPEKEERRERVRGERETEKDAQARVVEIPDGLDLVAWDRWVEYKKQIRKPLKQVSIPAAQKSLAAYGSDQAAVVEQSIAQGWQGLFPLKEGAKKTTVVSFETKNYGSGGKL